MLGRRLAGTTGIRSITTLPRGPGSREQPRSAPPLADRPGPGRLGRPQTTRARNAGGERVVLVRPRRSGWLAALGVAASALAAVLLYRYVDLGSLGPLPDMYENTWQVPGKLLSAYAEGAAVVLADWACSCTAVCCPWTPLPLRWGDHRDRATRLAVGNLIQTAGFVGSAACPRVLSRHATASTVPRVQGQGSPPGQATRGGEHHASRPPGHTWGGGPGGRPS
jgi:hypothetical protein